MSTAEILGKLGMCQSTVSRLSKRGENFAGEQKVELIAKEIIKA